MPRCRSVRAGSLAPVEDKRRSWTSSRMSPSTASLTFRFEKSTGLLDRFISAFGAISCSSKPLAHSGAASRAASRASRPTQRLRERGHQHPATEDAGSPGHFYDLSLQHARRFGLRSYGVMAAEGASVRCRLLRRLRPAVSSTPTDWLVRFESDSLRNP